MDLLELSMSHDKPGGSGAAATTGAVRAQRKKRRRGGLGASTRSGSRGGDDGPTQSTDGSCAADTRRTVSEVHLPVGARKVRRLRPRMYVDGVLTHTALSLHDSACVVT